MPEGNQTPRLSPKTLLAERFLIERLLGRGGTAEVYSAFDLRLGHRVALKRLLLDNSDPKLLARLRHEFQVVEGIEHPNVLRIDAFLMVDGVALLSMELLEGQDLKAAVQGRASLASSLRWVTHACAGLEQLHMRGWIHCDVKPANLFLTKQGVLKLTDFGLATEGAGSDRLFPGAITGTPEFMAPEQISGKGTLGPATDLYALGVILWRLIAGRLPFQSADVMKLLRCKLDEEAPSLRGVCPQVPPELDDLVQRLMDRDPARRPQSTADLRAELAPLWRYVRAPLKPRTI